MPSLKFACSESSKDDTFWIISFASLFILSTKFVSFLVNSEFLWLSVIKLFIVWRLYFCPDMNCASNWSIRPRLSLTEKTSCEKVVFVAGFVNKPSTTTSLTTLRICSV